MIAPRRPAVARARALMQGAGLSSPLDAVTSSRTVGERQKLEILRSLRRARAVRRDLRARRRAPHVATLAALGLAARRAGRRGDRAAP
ncbi:hypothetical protein WMF18_27605 [Sorangium sp. So ce315]|uniref:hypothetical protein n=1 Tax=Sorangium sp. So ce315 TaxID=3133299 RepID=UPI003F6256DD